MDPSTDVFQGGLQAIVEGTLSASGLVEAMFIPAPTPSPDDDGSAVEGKSQIEAWIDDEGLMRGLEAEQEIVGTPSMQIHDVMEFFDYGVQAGFTAPAEAEIFTDEVANPTQVCMGVHPDEAR